MGSSKNGGFDKLSTLTPQQQTYLNQMLTQYQPGGGGQGGQALTDQANANFQNQTVPDILSQYGHDNKGSSYLNSALAGASSNLNRDLAVAKSNQALQAGQIGLGTQAFGYNKGQLPLWQQLAQGGAQGLGSIFAPQSGQPQMQQGSQPWWQKLLSGAGTGAAAGSTVPGWGTAIGGALGGLAGLFGRR